MINWATSRNIVYEVHITDQTPNKQEWTVIENYARNVIELRKRYSIGKYQQLLAAAASFAGLKLVLNLLMIPETLLQVNWTGLLNTVYKVHNVIVNQTTNK